MIIDALKYNHWVCSQPIAHGISPKRERPLCEPPDDRESAFIRLAALLHDIGHVSAGHTLEDELNILGKHDKMQRLSLIFDRTDWPGKPEEELEPGRKWRSLRQVIDENYADVRPAPNVTPTDLLLSIIARDPKNFELPKKFRINVCRDIVGNTICADLLDYLHRDWYHIGKPRFFETRLLQYMEIRADYADQPQFVISLGESPHFRSDAITQIVSLLESRYELAEVVLFHRVRAAAAAMLERAIQELRSAALENDVEKWTGDLERRLLDWSDREAVLQLLEMSKNNRPALRPLLALLRRELYCPVFSTSEREAPNVFEDLVNKFGSPDESLKGEALAKAQEQIRKNRLDVVRRIERDLALPAGSVGFYFPAKEMNAKIPKVKIHVDGAIRSFDEWNEKRENFMDAGHANAQQIRFRRLWRAFVFLDSSVHEKMSSGMKDLLERVVKDLIFDLSVSHFTREEVAYNLAKQATEVADCAHFGKTLTPLAKAAQSMEPKEVYPFGAPSLLTFLAK